jgi:hypothetical protein
MIYGSTTKAVADFVSGHKVYKLPHYRLEIQSNATETKASLIFEQKSRRLANQAHQETLLCLQSILAQKNLPAIWDFNISEKSKPRKIELIYPIPLTYSFNTNDLFQMKKMHIASNWFETLRFLKQMDHHHHPELWTVSSEIKHWYIYHLFEKPFANQSELEKVDPEQGKKIKSLLKKFPLAQIAQQLKDYYLGNKDQVLLGPLITSARANTYNRWYPPFTFLIHRGPIELDLAYLIARQMISGKVDFDHQISQWRKEFSWSTPYLMKMIGLNLFCLLSSPILDLNTKKPNFLKGYLDLAAHLMTDRIKKFSDLSSAKIVF